jgi:hypothetical protein
VHLFLFLALLGQRGGLGLGLLAQLALRLERLLRRHIDFKSCCA